MRSAESTKPRSRSASPTEAGDDQRDDDRRPTRASARCRRRSRSRPFGRASRHSRIQGLLVSSKSTTRTCAAGDRLDRRPQPRRRAEHGGERRRHRPQRGRDASTASAMATTPRGSTTTSWRPGHHQPCIVRATKVAVSQPAASGRRATAQPGGRRRSEEAERRTAASNQPIIHAPMPKPSSTSRPTSRRRPAEVVGLGADDGELAGLREVVAGRVRGPSAVDRPVGDEVADAGDAERAGHDGERRDASAAQLPAADARAALRPRART